MLCRKIILALFVILIISICLFAQTDSLISRCQAALDLDMNLKNSEETIIALIDEIKRDSVLYLKSGLYTEIRKYYENLQKKLADYYYQEKDFEKALRCYSEADKYSEFGYIDKIADCEEKLKNASKINDPGTDSLKQEQLLTKLEQCIDAGGNSKTHIETIKKIADQYKQRFKKNTPWDTCISLLEKYYQAKSENNYSEMLALYYGTPDLMTSCPGILNKWNVMNKKMMNELFREYYENQAQRVLGDKGDKKEPDFTGFITLHNQIRQYLNHYISGEWKIRFDFLKAYFEAKTVKEEKNASKNLYQYFPDLAKSYSIPKPQATIVDTGPTGKSPSYSTNSPQHDYNKLKEMWEQVKKMNTEQEVVHYILRRAPLRIKGARSAKAALRHLFNWHNNWNDLQPNRENKIKALNIIANLQTFADNPWEQNEIYNYILNRYPKEEIIKSGLKDIDTMIENNNLYLILYEAWEENMKLTNHILENFDKTLKYELLTLEQVIQAHCMLGALNENPVPACFHYGSAHQLMKTFKIAKIYLVWNKEVIAIDKLKQDVCEHCASVKRDWEAEIEFKRRYEDRGVFLDDLIRHCPGDINPPSNF